MNNGDMDSLADDTLHDTDDLEPDRVRHGERTGY